MGYDAFMAKGLKSIEKVGIEGSPRRNRRALVMQPPTARVVVTRSPIPTATGLAERLGLLERDPHGEEPSAGSLHEGDNVTALWARSRGRATRLVGLTAVPTFQAVIALPGSGIVEAAQLAGRRLALPLRDHVGVGVGADLPRAAACRGFHAATALAGLFADEVAYVDLALDRTGATASRAGEPYAAELTALLRGDVDAIYVAGAAGAAAAARIGALTVVDLGTQLDPMVRAGATVPATLTADARLVEERPQLVARVLASLLDAGAWARHEPDAATRLVAEEVGATPAAVIAAHGPRLHERFLPDLADDKLAVLRAQRDFLRTHGFLAGDVDLAAWIDPAPLAAAHELLAG